MKYVRCRACDSAISTEDAKVDEYAIYTVYECPVCGRRTESIVFPADPYDPVKLEEVKK